MSGQGDPALALALKHLRVRERTEAELRAHLLRKGLEADEVERVIAVCRERRFVSDNRVAEREKELATTRRRLGRSGLAAQLSRRGVQEDVADGALSAYPEEDERANAERLLAERKPASAAQAARFLASRGFGEETIEGVLDQFFPGWSD